ncbi:MAG: glycosyl transferase family 2, partial [Bacteroidetes bacterium HGW-Bacteroidetes-17]
MRKIPIVVVTYNRAESLKRILVSLAKARYDIEVELIISIDGGGDHGVVKMANEYNWSHGKKRIIIREKNLGLREHMIRCGDIALENDGVVILEDDLYVSPVFYSFVEQALNFYEQDENIGGFSLYAHQFNETAQFPFLQISDNSDIFFLQYASSWGQFYTKKQWIGFREWYNENKDMKLNEDYGMP